WCLEHIPQVRAAREQGYLAAGPLAAFLLYSLLAGRPYCIDPANASRTQLWDPRTRTWDEQLLQLFGVPRQILAQCVASCHAFGQLPFAGGSIPLLVCPGDQSATPFAFGPLDARRIYLNVGTGAFLQLAQAGEDGDPRLLRSVLWADAQRTIQI